MGGAIDWTAITLLADIYGVDDLEMLIGQLTAIRQHQLMIAKPTR